MSAPTIYRLDIQRFRGIKNLLWLPGKSVNVILGGGDGGKTTILDAIGLLPVALRRGIGLVRLSGDARNDHDLRLLQGSALDRLISDKRFRFRLSSGLAKKGIKDELTEQSKKVLEELDKDFAARNLPA